MLRYNQGKEYAMKKTVKILVAVWIVFMLVVVVANLFGNSIKTEMVQHGEMEKAYSFEAMLIREETGMSAGKSGVLESMVEDNEMVRKNKHVASIYESKVDAEVKNKLANINIRIEEITKVKEESSNVVSAGYTIEAAMKDKVEELTVALRQGNVKKAYSLNSEIHILNDKKNVWEKGEEYTDDVLDELLKEKAEYERKLGNAKEDLFSPTSGIYSTHIDGYEQLLNPAAVESMSVDDFNTIKNMKVSAEDIKKSGYQCKIIDNFTWSVAFTANKDEISKLKKGSVVYVRNANSPKDMKAVVSYISTPTNDKYVVIVTSDIKCDWAMKDRFVKIDLIKNKYSGLKVPMKALRVRDGKTGVYVVVDGIVKFKNVNVLYKDSGYAIVEENNTSRGGLLLYDEIIVSSSKEYKVGDKIS